MSAPDLWLLAAGAVVTTLAGLVAAAAWRTMGRAGAKLLAALVEIARLPAVVDQLVERLDRLAGLGERVEKLEASLRITTEPEGVSTP